MAMVGRAGTSMISMNMTIMAMKANMMRMTPGPFRVSLSTPLLELTGTVSDM